MSKPLFLADRHQKMKAKLSPFSGYQMPMWYQGMTAEHRAVREAAGLFDISHMGLFHIKGEDPIRSLQTISCNSTQKARGRKMTYSMVLNRTGTIKDDIMLAEYAQGDIFLVSNASNATTIAGWITDKVSDPLTIHVLNDSHAFLALQGPTALSVWESATGVSVNDHPPFSLWTQTVFGREVWLSRTGYTGEDGLEILVSHDVAGMVWDVLLDAGALPCGLAARDTLRIEAGLPLYGQELSADITPLQTRYRWVISWKETFIGKEALVAEKEHVTKKTVGLVMKERVIPRPGYPIKEGGHITSGTLSASLDKGIAMAIVPTSLSDTHVHVDIRGRLHEATIVSLPFLSS